MKRLSSYIVRISIKWWDSPDLRCLLCHDAALYLKIVTEIKSTNPNNKIIYCRCPIDLLVDYRVIYMHILPICDKWRAYLSWLVGKNFLQKPTKSPPSASFLEPPTSGGRTLDTKIREECLDRRERINNVLYLYIPQAKLAWKLENSIHWSTQPSHW